MMKNETGRSMVEMLGVLAIIGVLSVGGIAGYTMAMNKYKANEVLNVISMLSTVAHAQNAGEGLTSGGTLTASSAGLTLPSNTSVTEVTATGLNGKEYYQITLTGASGDVLKNIKNGAPGCTSAATANSAEEKTAKRIGWCLSAA